MYIELFQQLGLSKNEAQIYEALLKCGEANISKIAKKTGINRRNVYDVLNRMMDKGLVYLALQKKENLYSPAEPNRLREMLNEKENILLESMPNLEALFHSQQKENEVYIYKGPEGWKNYMRDMIRIGKPAYFINAKGAWLDKRVSHFFPQFYKQAQKKQIRFYHLFDPKVKNECPHILDLIADNYRFLPEGYSAPGAIDIFGDHVNILSNIKIGGFEEDFSFTVIVNPHIAESFRTWFRMMWDMCDPISHESNLK